MATSISALVGWAWTSPTRRHAIQGLVGWDQADLSRDLILKDGAGATLAQISDKTNLEGYSLAVEAETAWLWDSWTLGVHTGATWRSLSGDATWSSGNYHGKESFDGSLLSLYVGGSVGLRF